MTLTVALWILGALVLVGVVAHGVWSARRARPRRETEDARTAPAAFERRDPSLGAPPSASGDLHPTPSPSFELRRDNEAPVAAFERPPPIARRDGASIDALIDAIAPLKLDAPVSGEFILAHLPASRRAGSKPWLIEGLDTENGQWHAPVPGARYSELQAAVQLANRSGALNAIEYSEFVQKVQAFADAIGAAPDFPDMLDVVERARELDAFASANDAQLAVHLHARGAAWTVGYVAQQAKRHGFVAGPAAGRLVLPNDEPGAPPVLVLLLDVRAALADDPALATVRHATLTLDVAQTDAAREAFVAWQEKARALAADLEADLVDERGAPMAIHALATTHKELLALYERLEQRDLAAGSAAARRLFS